MTEYKCNLKIYRQLFIVILLGVLVVIDSHAQSPSNIKFTTTNPNGQYNTGDHIRLEAQFDNWLGLGSEMKVVLNTGDTIALTFDPQLAEHLLDPNWGDQLTDNADIGGHTAYYGVSCILELEGKGAYPQNKGMMVIAGGYQDYEETGNDDFVITDNDGKTVIHAYGTRTANVLSDEVRWVIETSDGGLLLGGEFQNFMDNPDYDFLVKLKGDFTIDTQFMQNLTASGRALNGVVGPRASNYGRPGYCMVENPLDSSLYIGGAFTQVGGVNRHGVVKLDRFGNIDANFDAGYTGGGGSALAIDGDYLWIGSSMGYVSSSSGGRYWRKPEDAMQGINYNYAVDKIHLNTGDRAAGYTPIRFLSPFYGVLGIAVMPEYDTSEPDPSKRSPGGVLVTGRFHGGVDGHPHGHIVSLQDDGSVTPTSRFDISAADVGRPNDCMFHRSGEIFWAVDGFAILKDKIWIGVHEGFYDAISNTAIDGSGIRKRFFKGSLAVLNMNGTAARDFNRMLDHNKTYYGGGSGFHGQANDVLSVYVDKDDRLLVGGNYDEFMERAGGATGNDDIITRLTFNRAVGYYTPSSDDLVPQLEILEILPGYSITGAFGDPAGVVSMNNIAQGDEFENNHLIGINMPVSLAEDGFITTWTVEAGDLDITLPNATGPYRYLVDWGDGKIVNGVHTPDMPNITAHTSAATYTYDSPGTYTVTVMCGNDTDNDGYSDGTGFPRIYFNNTGDKDKIQTVEQWGTIKWTSMNKAFYGCSKLSNVAGASVGTAPDFSACSDLSSMFKDCASLDSDLSKWSVGTIVNMEAMFSGALAFNKDLSAWNVAEVTNMKSMFAGASVFNNGGQPMDWGSKVNKVQSFESMFEAALVFDADISSWQTTAADNMNAMFRNAAAFNQNIASWSVGSVATLISMFEGATTFNQDISVWDISSLTNANQMLIGATSFSLNNYDQLLIEWANKLAGGNANNSVRFASSSQYCVGENARKALIDAGWGDGVANAQDNSYPDIVDGGAAAPDISSVTITALGIFQQENGEFILENTDDGTTYCAQKASGGDTLSVAGNANADVSLILGVLTDTTEYILWADRANCPRSFNNHTLNVYPKADTLISTITLLTSGNKTADGIEQHQIKVIVRDVLGNLLAGAGVVFSPTPGVTFSNDTLVTNASGEVVLTITSTIAADYSTYVSVYTINPEKNNHIENWGDIKYNNPVNYTFSSGTPLATNSSLVLQTQASNIVADTVDAHILVATIKDTYNNPVVGHAVDFAATANGSDEVRFYWIDESVIPLDTTYFAPGAATTGLLSDINGQVKIYATTSKAWTGFTTSATFNDGTTDVAFAQSPLSYSYVAGSPNYANSSVVAVPTSAPAGSNITLTGTLLDAFNNPCRGLTTLFKQATLNGVHTQFVSYNGGGFATVYGTSNNDGQFIVSASSNVANTYVSHGTLEVNGAVVTGKDATYTFTAANPDPNTIETYVDLVKNNAEADSVDQNKIKVYIADSYGNKIENANVKIEAQTNIDWGSGLNTDHIIPTNADGEAKFSGISKVAGNYTTLVLIDSAGVYRPIADHSATDPDRANPVNHKFIAGQPQLSNSSVEVINSPAIADNVDSVRIKVTLRDAANNTISGDTVVFFRNNDVTYTLHQGTVATGSPANEYWVVTDANGIADIKVRTLIPNDYITTGTALINGAHGAFGQAAYTFVAGPAFADSCMVSVHTNNQEVNLYDSLLVKLFDAQGNALDTVRAVTVIDFAATSGVSINGAGVGAAYSHTLSIGDAAEFLIPVTSGSAGTYSTAVSLGGTDLTGSPVSYSFLAGAPAAAKSKVEVVVNGSLADGSAENTITATIRDNDNNPVQGVYVGFRGVPGVDLGQGSGAHAGVVTGVDGTATVKATATKAGPYGTYVAFSSDGSWNINSFAGNVINDGGNPAAFYFVDEYTELDTSNKLAIRAKWYVLQEAEAPNETTDSATLHAGLIAWHLDSISAYNNSTIAVSGLAAVNTAQVGPHRVDFTVTEPLSGNTFTHDSVMASVVDSLTIYDETKELALYAKDYTLDKQHAISHDIAHARTDGEVRAWSLSDYAKNDLLSSVSTSTLNNIKTGASGKYPLTFTLSDNGQSVQNPVEVTVVEDNEWFITSWETTGSNETITLPTLGGGYDFSIDWGDGSPIEDLIGSGPFSHTYTTADTFVVRIGGSFPRIYFNHGFNGQHTQKILSVEQWGAIAWQSMEFAFAGCERLTLSDTIISSTNVPDLSSVTNMKGMFSECKQLNSSSLNSWDVSSVTDMDALFKGAENFNHTLAGWNTVNVNTMAQMFEGALAFNQDLSNWDVSNVQSMNSMFYHASAFNSPLNWGIKTTGLEETESMFEGATAFDQNIGGWHIDSLTNANHMFKGAELSVANYDSLLINWNAQLVAGSAKKQVLFHGGSSRYCAGEAARANLIAEGWGDALLGGNPANNLDGTDGIVDGGSGIPRNDLTFSSDQSVCLGSSATFTLESQEYVAYQLYNKADDSQVGSPVTGTGALISFTVSPSVTTTYYAEGVSTDFTCSSILLDEITISIDPVSEGGSILGSQTVCSGNNSVTLSLDAKVGDVVSWQYSPDNFISWNSYAVTDTFLVANNLTQTTYYRAQVKSGACASAYSTTAIISVDPVSVGGNILPADTAIYFGDQINLALSGETGTILYWEKSTDNFTSSTTIAHTGNHYTTDPIVGTTYYRAAVQSGVCDTVYSAQAIVRISNGDFGDAPSSYGTLRADNGAEHASTIVTNNVYIGTMAPDYETDGQPTADAGWSGATGDDGSGSNDEDGLSFAFETDRSNITLDSIRVVNATDSTAYLYAWIDIDRDGNFNAGEQAMASIPANTTDTVNLSFTGFNYQITPGDYYVRLRTGTVQTEVGQPTGWASNGEVEDHKICVFPDTLYVNDAILHTCSDFTGDLHDYIQYTPQVGNPVQWFASDGSPIANPGSFSAASLPIGNVSLLRFVVTETYCNTQVRGEGTVFLKVESDLVLEDKQTKICIEDADQINLNSLLGIAVPGTWSVLTPGAGAYLAGHLFSGSAAYGSSTGDRSYTFKFTPGPVSGCLQSSTPVQVTVIVTNDF